MVGAGLQKRLPDPAYAAQLTRYRAAVQAAHPGHTVRAALLSADGRMTEMPFETNG